MPSLGKRVASEPQRQRQSLRKILPSNMKATTMMQTLNLLRKRPALNAKQRPKRPKLKPSVMMRVLDWRLGSSLKT